MDYNCVKTKKASFEIESFLKILLWVILFVVLVAGVYFLAKKILGIA